MTTAAWSLLTKPFVLCWCRLERTIAGAMPSSSYLMPTAEEMVHGRPIALVKASNSATRLALFLFRGFHLPHDRQGRKRASQMPPGGVRLGEVIGMTREAVMASHVTRFAGHRWGPARVPVSFDA